MDIIISINKQFKIGSELHSLGPVGRIVGAALIAVGADEIAYGITGTNYIQEWTGMSDSVYNGLYLGLNIVSAVGQIAGSAYHLRETREMRMS